MQIKRWLFVVSLLSAAVIGAGGMMVSFAVNIHSHLKPRKGVPHFTPPPPAPTPPPPPPPPPIVHEPTASLHRARDAA